MTTTSFREALSALIPTPDRDESAYLPAFRSIADLVLNRVTLHIAGHPHRFTEVEFYFNGPRHGDTFTHGDEMQRELGRWYFHRTAGEYRGGTYKGLDIAFGRSDAPAGILIRGVEQLDGARALLDGPCMCVDHILSMTSQPSIASLVSTFDRSTDAPATGASPLFIAVDDAPRAAQRVYECPRVGLTLKRGASEARVRYLPAPYRFLTEPARIKKGRLNLVVGLHAQGVSAAEIAKLTGSASSQVSRYVEQYESGKGVDPQTFRRDLSSEETCQAFAACAHHVAAKKG